MSNANNAKGANGGNTTPTSRAAGEGSSGTTLAKIRATLDNFACTTKTDQEALTELINKSMLMRANGRLVTKNAKSDEIFFHLHH